MSFVAHHSIDDAADAAALAKSKNDIADFDDINTGKSGEKPINNVYAGMEWDDFNAFNPTVDFKGQHLDGSGFFVGVTSGDQAAYAPDGGMPDVFRANGTFTLNSVEMTAAVDKKLEVFVNAYDHDGKQIDHIKIEITDAKPTLEKLNLQNVAEVIFFPENETPDPKWGKSGASGPYMVFDDFVFSNLKGTAATTPSGGHLSAGNIGAHGHLADIAPVGHELHAGHAIA